MTSDYHCNGKPLMLHGAGPGGFDRRLATLRLERYVEWREGSGEM